MNKDQPVGRAETRSTLEWEVGGQISGRLKIGHKVACGGSPPLRHFFEKSCVSHRRNDTEMGSAYSLTSAQY